MTTLLNNYDMVLAVSQDTINNQFFLLFAEGVISNTIDIAYMPSNPALQLNATLNAPTVELELDPVNPNQLDFNINFASGTFTYMDFSTKTPTMQTADVSGWVITMLVNLEQMTITSATPPGLNVSSGAQGVLNNYIGNDAFTIEALFLDFDNVNMSQLIINADGVKMQPTDPRYVFVLMAMQQMIASLKTNGNPYILGFHASSNHPEGTNPQLPKLAPTSVQFISNQYNYQNGQQGPTDDGLSCLCYLAMTENQPLPFPDGKEPTFVWNPIPSSSVQARMFIDNNTFNTAYVHDLVLPVLQKALNTGGNWTQSGDSWTLDYQSNIGGNDNDGHGIVVGEDWPENIYGLTTTENFCTIALDVTNSTANQLLYNGSGYLYQKLDVYEHPFDIWMHDAWTSTKLSFTFTLTISAGANGDLSVTFNPSAGQPDQQHWENTLIKISDFLGQWFVTKFEDQLETINSQWADFEKFQFSSFTTSAAQGFQGLSAQLILPAPQQFYYSNIGLNSENDVVLDIGYKS